MQNEEYENLVKYGYGVAYQYCREYGVKAPDEENLEEMVKGAVSEAWVDLESREADTTIDENCRDYHKYLALCIRRSLKRWESASWDENGKMHKKGGFWQSSQAKQLAKMVGIEENKDFLDDEGSRQARVTSIEVADKAVSELPSHIAPIAKAVLNPANRGKTDNGKIGTMSSVSIEREFGVGRKRAASMLTELLSHVARGFVKARKDTENEYFAFKSALQSTQADETCYSTYVNRMPVLPQVIHCDNLANSTQFTPSSYRWNWVETGKITPTSWEPKPKQNTVAWSSVANRQLWPTRQRAHIVWNGVAMVD